MGGGGCTRPQQTPVLQTGPLLSSLLLNTKPQRGDARSRPGVWAHPCSVCLSQVQAHPQSVRAAVSLGSAPKGVWEWKWVSWIILELLCCIHVHVGCFFNPREATWLLHGHQSEWKQTWSVLSEVRWKLCGLNSLFYKVTTSCDRC